MSTDETCRQGGRSNVVPLRPWFEIKGVETGGVEEFVAELLEVFHRYALDSHLNYAEYIGALEIVKDCVKEVFDD